VNQGATMGIDFDPTQSIRSLQRIKMIRDMQGATMWITHDPEDWKEHPHRID
jgi:N-acyl homoserine lactone hydrolase